MCGIVGHIGLKKSVETVLEGLKRLEYRGYDSSGISFLDHHNELQTFKVAAKVDELVRVVGPQEYSAQLSVGHTRWATHGKVSDNNAHPHTKGNISLVHNGIIENYQDLKSELVKDGYEFLSDTDSEVFLALVVKKMEAGLSFIKAISDSFAMVEGNSAFVVLNAKAKEVLAIKRGTSLVCGIHKTNSQVLVSSDPYAITGMVEKIYFPEDDVICSLSVSNKELLRFIEPDGSPSSRYYGKAHGSDLEVSSKGPFEHYMLKEIYEQPSLIRALPSYYCDGEGREALEQLGKLSPSHVHIAACGSAYYSSLVIRDYMESLNGIKTYVELASEFRYRTPIFGKGDLSVFVSQSGETADTLAAQAMCRDADITTLSLVNVEESTLFRECDYNLLIRAGIEIGVASTKAFTQMALTGRFLAQILSGSKPSSKEMGALTDRCYLLANRVDELFSMSSHIQHIAGKIQNCRGYLYTGRGIYAPIAYEGALKLKEITYVHAEGYASGELKHGPIAIIDEDIVNIAIIGPELYKKNISNLQEVKARQGIIVAIGPKGDSDLEEISDYVIPLDFSGLEELAPLYVNMANQLLAYHMAKFKGTDIDQPRNLAKSVTVE